MKKQKQEPGSTNCFAVCLATLLEIPVELLPKSTDGSSWDWQETQRWMADRFNAQLIEFRLDYDEGRVYPVAEGVECILTGQSPRPCASGQHAVVGRYVGFEGFKILHDPHPSNQNLASDPIFVTFIVPRFASSIQQRPAWIKP